MIESLRKWIYKQTDAFIKMDAKLVSKEIKESRLSACYDCPEKELKRIKPYLPEMESCKACGGCILETKSGMETHMRRKDLQEKPLSEEEILGYLKDKALGNTENYIEKIITCPLNKWENLK